MQSLALPIAPSALPAFEWQRSGTQCLPVSGHVTHRLFATYRAPAAKLAPLVPAPCELDTHAGFGFLSVCGVEIERMGIAGTPGCLRFQNREFLYRLAVRFRGEPTFITLRSDVSSRALALLGRYFSHYRPRRARVRLLRDEQSLRMECVSGDGAGDAVLEVDTSAALPPATSVFGSAAAATAFLLSMRFSADVVSGRVRVQPIDHSAWNPRFVQVRTARFAFLNLLERELGTRFVHDGTLAARDIAQLWRAARWA